MYLNEIKISKYTNAVIKLRISAHQLKFLKLDAIEIFPEMKESVNFVTKTN